MQPDALDILDFDGTFSDIEKEVPRFGRMFFEQVRQRIGASENDMDKLIRSQLRIIQAHPQKYGWINNGHIVAGALVDPYIEMRVVADLIFQITGAIPDAQARDEEFELYFKLKFRSVWTVFKSDTEATLQTLEQKNPGRNYFVSNSGTAVIQRKLRAFKGMDGLIDRIHGGARKYFVDDDYNTIPETMTIDGLSRPVYLRRRYYHEVIEDLLHQHGLQWRDVLVVGDIAEMDLFMPWSAGATVALMDHPRVPEYERQFFLSHPRAYLLASPSEIVSLLP